MTDLGRVVAQFTENCKSYIDNLYAHYTKKAALTEGQQRISL